ncbi:radical SAM protein [Puniceicoccaceae bacterium K14]|nr:radical SAM protein [Puniceicoccaceae bacterium K14]
METIPLPPEFKQGKLVKRTESICPSCLQKIDADVYARDGQVWMDKECAEHGHFSALLSNDIQTYLVSAAVKNRGASGCGCESGGCGAPVSKDSAVDNHSCTLMVEITQKCNLTCPTCYAASSPQNDDFLRLDKYRELLDTLREKEHGDADVLQISGGEPTLHPDMLEMVDIAYEKGFKQVYVNTNGIKLSQRKYAETLAASKNPIYIYLQFDGLDSKTYAALRGSERLSDVKQRALKNCEDLGIEAIPIMTLTKGINDSEVEAFLNVALSSSAVNKVMIQPAMYSGRYVNPRRLDRLTASDTIDLIVEQSGVFTKEDFTPIPCGDPNCFRMALAIRTESGLVPVSRYFPTYDQWQDEFVAKELESVSDTFDNAEGLSSMLAWSVEHGAISKLEEDKIDELLEAVALASIGKGSAGWRGLFAIGIKPFMDAYTYDQDRIDDCCAHIASQDGEPISFCQYNAINRAKGEL